MCSESDNLTALVSLFDEDDETDEKTTFNNSSDNSNNLSIKFNENCINDENEKNDLLSSLFASNSNQKKVLTNKNITLKKNLSINIQKQTALDNDVLSNSSNSINDSFDSAFGIRIKNPKITFEAYKNYYNEMKKIKLSALQTFNIPKDEDWITMGVIVNKSECRKSNNGKEYLIWNVSDLSNSQEKCLKVLLFSEIVKSFWKLQPGMVVLFINPFFDFDSVSKEITLKLAKVSQIIDIGFCPDFGFCKGLKQDGRQCKLHVNISKSDYCAFHMQNAAKKISAQRGVFNSMSNIPPKSYRLKDPTNSFEKILNLKTVPRNTEKRYVKPVSLHSKIGKQKLLQKNESSTITKNDSPTINKNFILGRATGIKRKQSYEPLNNALNSTNETAIKRVKSMKEFINSQNEQPNLGSRAKFGFVNLISPKKKMKNKIQLIEDEKIKKAAQILRSSNSSIKQTICKENDENKKLLENSTKKIDILALINKKSKFESEALEAIQDQQNRYFLNRETEEKIEANATSLMEIKNCKVVTCKSCNYTTISQSDYCKSLGHIIKRHTADKRFFKCKNCHTRVSCFKLMPTKPCNNCLVIDFERVSMRDERKVHSEKLLVRGEENHFIN